MNRETDNENMKGYRERDEREKWKARERGDADTRLHPSGHLYFVCFSGLSKFALLFPVEIRKKLPRATMKGEKQRLKPHETRKNGQKIGEKGKMSRKPSEKQVT